MSDQITTRSADLAETAARRFPALKQAMAEAVRRTDAVLDRVLPAAEGLHGRVPEAMRYAVFAGGKRLRPFLTMASAGLFDVPEIRSARAAAAIEVLHTYSLVHD